MEISAVGMLSLTHARESMIGKALSSYVLPRPWLAYIMAAVYQGECNGNMTGKI